MALSKSSMVVVVRIDYLITSVQTSCTNFRFHRVKGENGSGLAKERLWAFGEIRRLDKIRPTYIGHDQLYPPLWRFTTKKGKFRSKLVFLKLACLWAMILSHVHKNIYIFHVTISSHKFFHVLLLQPKNYPIYTGLVKINLR